MRHPSPKGTAVALLQGVLLAILISSVAVALQAQTPKIKQGTAPQTNPSSGAEMFGAYCAACHGKEAKGNGPAAPALKKAPPDLTQLSKNNGGTFPEMRVFAQINGDGNTVAHGSADMPVWGSVFRQMSGGRGAIDQLRLANLTAYIKSLQK
jgi:mono/diheme cytochrome c family protein